AGEGVFGGIQQCVVADAASAEGSVDGRAAGVRYVRILGAEDHEQTAANFFGAGERTGVGVLAELAVVDAGAVVAHRDAHVRLKGGAEGEVAADAETHDADFSRRDARMRGEPVEATAAVGVEMRNWSFRSVLLAARATGVVERNDSAGRLDAAIDFRRGGDKAVSGEAYAKAQQRRSELEDVGVAPDARIFSIRFGRGDERAHR